MKICSWNINSVRIRTEMLELLVEKHQPEIILLQEIKCENSEFPEFYKTLNYNLEVNGQKGRHGVAILLKKDLTYKRIDFESQILNLESRINGVSFKNLNIVNVYVPNGNPVEDKKKFDFKLKWLNELKRIVESFINNYENLLVAGDFNVLENESDVKDFDKWKLDALGKIETREYFRKILEKGLFNIERLFNSPGTNYSFWDYQKASWERNYGLLIDHFLASPFIIQNTKSIFFDKEFRGLERPSDHIPVIIEIEKNLNI
ncbi:MAG: exodeoxyribonuclease III [alpha proteobacterium MED-G10]|nr:MAG: exodeoxyribonuclease III [alpha proteobacterium MED-G10]